MKKRTCLIGKVFNRLTVIADAENINGKSASMCRCECGVVKSYRHACLISGNSKSCGCLFKETLLQRITKHGGVGTSEYATWDHIKDRCRNPNSERYADYGGRGITICDRWAESFDNFLEDMGKRPTPKHSIDRIKNNEGYSPDNCKWATASEQARNKRTSKIIVFKGESRCSMEWSEITGIHYMTIINRLNRGWSPERALTEKAFSGRNQFYVE